MMLFKILASTVVGLLGGYYMYRGKKTQNFKMILWGAVLIILSYVVFSGGGNDQDSKAMLNTLMQTTPGQQQP